MGNKILKMTIESYISNLTPERQEVIQKLREIIKKNLPKGFKECISYGMIGYVVPHEIYPSGYHCDPKLPLPFISIASQKNFVALYHMGIYADEELHNWFTDKYKTIVPSKLDMGKSCVRFKKMDQIPYELIGELAAKMSPLDWVERYTSVITKSKGN
jgi:uncharacterized protein YdhG (YjbR/CyaY superfamily)